MRAVGPGGFRPRQFNIPLSQMAIEDLTGKNLLEFLSLAPFSFKNRYEKVLETAGILDFYHMFTCVIYVTQNFK